MANFSHISSYSAKIRVSMYTTDSFLYASTCRECEIGCHSGRCGCPSQEYDEMANFSHISSYSAKIRVSMYTTDSFLYASTCRECEIECHSGRCGCPSQE